VEKILNDASELFKAEPNCLKVNAPCVAIGDLHGQYFDMIHMFEKVIDRRFPACELLFLGDYVDRGFNSVEVFTFLCVLKLNYPDRVHMLRGNHESRGMTEHFSFRSECLDKLGDEIAYDWFMDCFDTIPIAAEVFGEKSGNYLAMHGGISPNMRSKKDIDDIDRI
jgi:serine/threonine-protein phosphatase 2B catalytic subunit